MCFLTARIQNRPSVSNATMTSTSPTGTRRCAAVSRSCATQVGHPRRRLRDGQPVVGGTLQLLNSFETWVEIAMWNIIMDKADG